MKHLRKMRALCAALLCAALMCCLALPAAAKPAVKYVVTAAYANILPAPDAEKTPVGRLNGGDVVTVTKTENNFGHITVKSTGVSGWVYMPLLAFADDGSKNTDGVTGIYVKTPPDKLTYTEGETDFDAAGLEIYASYKNGEDAAVTGWRLYVPALAPYGEKTVQAAYTAPGGAVFTTSFTITVARVPLAAMELVEPPDKTEYVEGQALALAGLKVRLTYTDGRPEETCDTAAILADPDFKLMGCHSEADGKALLYGEHTLNLYYKYPDVTCSFRVTAAERSMTALEIESYPDSLVTYSNTAPPDLTGLKLRAVYNNGETETVLPAQCEIRCDPAAFILGENNRVGVAYGGKMVTLYFTYALDAPAGLTVLTPQVLNFILGEPIDLRSLRVRLTTTAGDDTELTDYEMSEIDPTLSGPQTVLITYAEYSETFTINISPYYQKGDADGDGKVTAADARVTLRTAVKLIRLTGNPFAAADVDGSGDITADDARTVLRAAVQLEKLISFENIVLLPQTAEKEITE